MQYANLLFLCLHQVGKYHQILFSSSTIFIAHYNISNKIKYKLFLHTILVYYAEHFNIFLIILMFISPKDWLIEKF